MGSGESGERKPTTKGAHAPLIQVFEPHRAATPPLIPYFKEFWERRAFALELARFADKAEYLESKLGKAWLILNPLFLSLVYFLLVTVLRGGANKNTGLSTLAHILIGIFMFYFAQNIISDGAQSITSGGRLILNQAFPRALLPFSSSVRAFGQFWPTIPTYFAVILIGKIFYPKTQIPLANLNYLWAPLIIAALAITAFGLSLVFAVMNVYFRDTSKLLTYTTRIWLYGSPVLWRPEMLHGWHRLFIYINPLGPALAATSHVWIEGIAPSSAELIGMALWIILAMAIGTYFFTSRERDFAVRI
jgi:teichoic acid transport system permease protein